MKKKRLIPPTMTAAGAVLLLLTALSVAGNLKVGAEFGGLAYWSPAAVGALALIFGVRAHKKKAVSAGDLAVYALALLACEVLVAEYGGYVLSFGWIKPLSLLLPILAAFSAGPVLAVIVSIGAGLPTLMNILFFPGEASYILVSAVGQIAAAAVFSVVLAAIVRYISSKKEK